MSILQKIWAVFPIVEGTWGVPRPSYGFFRNPAPLIKTDAPPWGAPPI